MAFLKPDKTYTEYGLTIHEKLITAASGVKHFSNRKLNTADHKPEYITIHNTPDINEAAGTNLAPAASSNSHRSPRVSLLAVHHHDVADLRDVIQLLCGCRGEVDASVAAVALVDGTTKRGPPRSVVEGYQVGDERHPVVHVARVVRLAVVVLVETL